MTLHQLHALLNKGKELEVRIKTHNRFDFKAIIIEFYRDNEKIDDFPIGLDGTLKDFTLEDIIESHWLRELKSK